MTQFKFDINGSKYEVEIKSIDGSIAEVDVNGNLYQVNIEGDGQISAPVARPAAKPTATPTPAATTHRHLPPLPLIPPNPQQLLRQLLPRQQAKAPRLSRHHCRAACSKYW